MVLGPWIPRIFFPHVRRVRPDWHQSYSVDQEVPSVEIKQEVREARVREGG